MSYMGSQDAISHRVARVVEERLLATGQERLAYAVYEAIVSVRNADDDIRRLTGQITDSAQTTLAALDAGQHIHEPYIDRLGIDLKLAVTKRASGYYLLVALLGQDEVTRMVTETKAHYAAKVE